MSERGQSLVETALIAPLLIFFLIGVFEVGYALRNYISLANATREAARFSVRPGYLDPTADNPVDIGFEDIWRQAMSSLNSSGMGVNADTKIIVYDKELDDKGIDPYYTIKADRTEVSPPNLRATEENASMQVTRIVVGDGIPCLPDEHDRSKCDCSDNSCLCDGGASKCTCDKLIEPTTGFTATHSLPGMTWQKGPHQFDLDVAGLAEQVRVLHLENSCYLFLRGGVVGIDEPIRVDMKYDSEQLFGFPLISNPMSDPIVLHTHTVFRRSEQRNFDQFKYLLTTPTPTAQ